MYIWLGIIALVLLYIIVVYNGLIRLKNTTDNSWAQIETQLQRRYDLIPNLVETVKGYAAHEKEVFENVTKARANMLGAQGAAEKAQASNALTDTLKSLFAVAEAYPDLKANQNFLQLQVDLKGTEDKVAFARQFYNDSVLRFNTQTEVFPTNILAKMLAFSKREYFEAENEEARKNVDVKF